MIDELQRAITSAIREGRHDIAVVVTKFSEFDSVRECMLSLLPITETPVPLSKARWQSGDHRVRLMMVGDIPHGEGYDYVALAWQSLGCNPEFTKWTDSVARCRLNRNGKLKWLVPDEVAA